jgi:hypothetical protein
MPRVCRYFIKAGMLYFVLAFAVGLIMALHPFAPLVPNAAALRPVFFHMVMIGWISQLIIGVAVWMFPKFTRTQPRGSERITWAVFVTLNSGLALRVLFEPLTVFNPGSDFGVLLIVSAVLQLIAGWMFVLNTWGRVKER